MDLKQFKNWIAKNLLNKKSLFNRKKDELKLVGQYLEKIIKCTNINQIQDIKLELNKEKKDELIKDTNSNEAKIDKIIKDINTNKLVQPNVFSSICDGLLNTNVKAIKASKSLSSFLKLPIVQAITINDKYFKKYKKKLKIDQWAKSVPFLPFLDIEKFFCSDAKKEISNKIYKKGRLIDYISVSTASLKNDNNFKKLQDDMKKFLNKANAKIIKSKDKKDSKIENIKNVEELYEYFGSNGKKNAKKYVPLLKLPAFDTQMKEVNETIKVFFDGKGLKPEDVESFQLKTINSTFQSYSEIKNAILKFSNSDAMSSWAEALELEEKDDDQTKEEQEAAKITIVAQDALKAFNKFASENKMELNKELLDELEKSETQEELNENISKISKEISEKEEAVAIARVAQDALKAFNEFASENEIKLNEKLLDELTKSGTQKEFNENIGKISNEISEKLDKNKVDKKKIDALDNKIDEIKKEENKKNKVSKKEIDELNSEINKIADKKNLKDIKSK